MAYILGEEGIPLGVTSVTPLLLATSPRTFEESDGLIALWGDIDYNTPLRLGSAFVVCYLPAHSDDDRMGG